MKWGLIFLIMVWGIASPSMAMRSLSPCKTGYIEWEDRPLSELVKGSHTIFLATAYDFVPDESREGFDGYYRMVSTGTELKGGAQGVVKVYGQQPYPYPPQSYFDVSSRHQKIADQQRASNKPTPPGGLTGYTVNGTYCPLSPRFVMGYTYLVLLGTESRMSFEPIHATADDAWYLIVRQAVDTERP